MSGAGRNPVKAANVPVHAAPVLDALNEPVLVERQGVVVYANSAAVHLLGYRCPGELCGQRLERLAEACPSKSVSQYCVVHKRDGRELLVDYKVSGLAREGKDAHLVVLRPALQPATSPTLRLTQLAVDQAVGAALTIDRRRRVIYANQQAADLLGRTRITLLGRSLAELFPGLEKSLPRKHPLPRRSLLMRAWCHAPEDRLLALEASFQPVRIADEDYGWLFLREWRRHVEDQQQLLMQNLGRASLTMAHDFNNLLTAITLEADQLSQKSSDSTVRQISFEIRLAAQRGAALVAGVIGLVSPQETTGADADLSATTREIGPLLRRLVGEQVELTIHAGENVGCVRAPAGQLQQIILNLALNARDAMPAGGHLIVRTGRVELHDRRAAELRVSPGDYGLLSVSDTGIGMDQATLARLYKPFFSTNGCGHGLGMVSVRNAVQDAGGGMEVITSPGKGTTVTLWLTRISPQSERRVIEMPRAMELRGEGRSVLIVEDDEQLRHALWDVLRGRAFEVIVADGAQHALASIEELGHAPDLLLADIRLPGMSGPELYRRLRRDWPDLRCLFISANTRPQLAQVSFCAKPFDATRLLAAMEQVLNGEKNLEQILEMSTTYEKFPN